MATYMRIDVTEEHKMKAMIVLEVKNQELLDNVINYINSVKGVEVIEDDNRMCKY